MSDIREDAEMSMVDSNFGPVPKGCVLSYQLRKSNYSTGDIINGEHPLTYPNFPLPVQGSYFHKVLSCREDDV